MKHSFKKLTAWLCCMAMLISFIPATALPVFADEAEGEVEWTIIEVTQTAGELPALEENSSYELESDLTLTGDLTVPCYIGVDQVVTLDLAGHNLIAGETADGGIFAVDDAAGHLTIKDSIGGGKLISGTSNGTPAVQVQAGEFTLEAGEITGWSRAGAGGMVFVGANGTFNMGGGKLTGASANYGAAIRCEGGTVNMNGGEISGNTATDRAVIRLASGSEMTMTGGEIKNNTATNYGVVRVCDGATFTMTDGVISGNTAKYGAGVYSEGATEITGGTLTGNEATAGNGGAVYVKAGETTVGGDAIITENTAVTYAGGIFVDKNATLNIEGGEISENSAQRGAGVSGAEAGSSNVTINISGGTIENNHGTQRGANLYGYDVTFNISGGTIGAATHNDAAAAGYLNVEHRGGNLNISGGTIATIATGKGTDYSVLNITGAPKIADLVNSSTNTESTIGQLTEGADITYSAIGGLKIADGTVKQVGKNFTYQKPTVPTSGTVIADEYVLEGDLVLTNTLTIAADTEVVIDLAGNTISMPDRDGVYFTVNGKLTIKDSAGGGKIQFKNTTAGHGGINLNGTLVLESGELTGWTRGAADAGGMINAWGGSTFIMTGGTITGNSCGTNVVYRTQGDGANSTVTISGGEITGNSAGTGNIIFLRGTAAAPSSLTITGNAKIGGNIFNGGAFAPAGTGHEVEAYNAHVVIDGNAEVAHIYNNGDNVAEGDAPYSSFDISGAPIVGSVRWNSGAKTPIKVHDLTDGAEIKMTVDLSGSQIDATVAKTTEGSFYIYSHKVPTYAVTVNQVAGGTIEVDVTEGIEGATVTVTATAAEGFELEAILVNGKAIDGNTFAIVAGDNVVTATFKAVDVGLPTSGVVAPGEYTLEEDLTLTAWLTIRDEVVIDLAGHTITAPEGGNAFLLDRAESKLTLKDGVGGGKVQSGASTAGNPAVFIQAGEFILDGGEITGWNREGKAGGMVYLLAGTTFTMNGGKLTGASGANASTIRTANGDITININGGEISGNATTQYGAIYLGSGVTMNITDGTFTNNTAATEGGLFRVAAGATLNISGGEFTKNTAKSGGVIYNEGTVAITGGTFADNTATSMGGVLALGTVASASSPAGIAASVTGGTFTGNTAARGGAIATNDAVVPSADLYPTLTIGGDAEFVDNICTDNYGGNIYTYTTNVTIQGGTIGTAVKGEETVTVGSGNIWLRDGSAAITGGYIRGIATSGTVAVSGAPEIRELNGNFTISNLTSGAYVRSGGVTQATIAEGDETVFTEDNRDYYFVGDLEPETYTVVVVNPLGGTVSVDKTEAAEGETITVTAEAAEGYELKGILVNGEAIEGNTFVMPAADVQVSATFEEKVVEPEGLPTSGVVAAGEYTLEEDLTLTAWLNICDEVVIDLAGHTITAPEGGNAFLLDKAASKLTIKDSVGGGKVVSGASTGNPAIFLQGAGAQFILDGGEITGWNRAGGAGGMVYLLAGTTFTMNGGKLTGASCAGNAIIRTGAGASTITINGGEISGNSVTGNAPIGLASGVTMNITDGVFTGNTAGGYGLIHVGAGATLNISGGEFTENTAKNGGVIYNEGTVAITGGTFADNTATSMGGVLALGTVASASSPSGIAASVTGGTFTGNTAARGGAIATNDAVVPSADLYPTLTIGGDVVIEDNICTNNYGGNIYTYTTNVTIQGGTIGTAVKGEETVTVGSGNIWLRDGSATITGGYIRGIVASGTVAVSGNPVIGEISATMTMSALTSGANIRTAGVGMVTAGDDTVYTTNDRDFFFKGDLGFGDKFVAGETVTLTENTSVGAGVQLTAAGEYTLDLAGFELTGNAAPYFTVGAGVKLTVIDSSENKTGKVVGLTTATEAMILVDGGEFVLNDGALTGHTSTKNGGAIRVKSGSATMNGGSITGNTAVPTFTWNEAKQIYTLSNGYGAGVYLEKGAAFTMNGGEISGNTASRGAGVTGVEMGSANITITLNGGTIKDNTAYERGANVYAYDPALVTFGEVTIGASYDKSFNGTPELEDDTVTLTTATYRNIEVRGGNAAFTGGTYKMVSLGKGSANVTATISGAPKFEVLNANNSNTTIGNLTTGARIVVDTNFPLTIAEGDKTVNAQVRLYRYAGDVKSILFVANSFGGDTINYMTKLGNYFGIEVDPAGLYVGSQSIRWHAQSLAESLRNTDLNGDGVIGDSRDRVGDGLYTCHGFEGYVDIPTVLESKEWDYVVLQPGVQYVGYEGTYNSDIDFLMDYIKAVQPEDTKILWSQTWAVDNRKWSTQVNPDAPESVEAGGQWLTGSTYLDQFGGSQEVMYDAILRNTDLFFAGDDARFDVDGYLPIGIAVQTMRQNYTDSYLTRDGFHLSKNAGRMIAGLTTLKTLFPDIDLSKLTAADMAGMFDADSATDVHLNDAFEATDANVATLLAAVETACGYAAADTVPAYGDGTANKQFNPDAAGNFVAVYEGVTEVGNLAVSLNGESVIKELYATAGAGKIVIYKNGVKTAAIDELWLEENAGIVLTDRYDKVVSGEDYFIMADPQAPQLAIIGSTLYLTFDVKLYSDTQNTIVNGGIYMTTSTDGVTWTPAVKVSDAPMAYGLTAISDGLIMSVADTSTKVLKLDASGTVTNTVELCTDIADVAFAEVDGTVYALTSTGKVYISADKGATWTATAIDAGEIASPDMVAIGTKGVYISWADESNKTVYYKIWTIIDNADLGWSYSEAHAIGTYAPAIGYNNKTSGGQVATVEVPAPDNNSRTFRTVYVSNGQLQCSKDRGVGYTSAVTMKLESSLTIRMGLPISAITRVEGTSAKILRVYSKDDSSRGNGETKAPVWTMIDSLSEYTEGTFYRIPYEGVAAKEMGDKVYLAVFDDQGNQVSVMHSYSAAEFAYKELNKSTVTPEMATVLVDLLNYGAAAQANFKYDVANPVNAKLTEKQKAFASEPLTVDKSLEEGVVGAEVKAAVTLVTESAITISVNYAIQAALADELEERLNGAQFATIDYVDHNGNAVNMRIDELEDGTLAGGPAKKVKIASLAAADGRTIVTVRLHDKDGNEIAESERTVTIFGVAYNSLKNGYNEANSEHVAFMRLMQYSNSAYNFFH